MKAKELLAAAFTIRKGSKYQSIVEEVVEGEINPRASYIQTFDAYAFCSINAKPDVVFITTAGSECYLFKVD